MKMKKSSKNIEQNSIKRLTQTKDGPGDVPVVSRFDFHGGERCAPSISTHRLLFTRECPARHLIRNGPAHSLSVSLSRYRDRPLPTRSAPGPGNARRAAKENNSGKIHHLPDASNTRLRNLSSVSNTPASGLLGQRLTTASPAVSGVAKFKVFGVGESSFFSPLVELSIFVSFHTVSHCFTLPKALSPRRRKKCAKRHGFHSAHFLRRRLSKKKQKTL